MAFLTVNNVDIPVAESSASFGFTSEGSLSQVSGGSYVDARIGNRREFSFSTSPMRYLEAVSFSALIEGDGHTITMNDGMSGITGMSSCPGYYQVFFDDSLQPPVGTHSLVVAYDGFTSSGVASRSSGAFSFDCQLKSDQFTVLWYEAGSSGVWSACARTSQGRGYINGSRNDSVGSFGVSDPSPVSYLSIANCRGILKFAVANNSLANGVTGSDVRVSDVVIIPEVMYGPHLELMTATPSVPLTYQLFDRPFVTARGDFLSVSDKSVSSTERMACIGRLSSFEYVPCYINNVYENNAVSISFSLVEYEEAYANHV